MKHWTIRDKELTFSNLRFLLRNKVDINKVDITLKLFHTTCESKSEKRFTGHKSHAQKFLEES